MSTPRTALIHAALFALTLLAGSAQAGSTSATMSVGLTLRAPAGAMQEPRHAGAINADGRMRTDGMQDASLDESLARAPRHERLGDRLPDGSRLHSIQF